MKLKKYYRGCFAIVCSFITILHGYSQDPQLWAKRNKPLSNTKNYTLEYNNQQEAEMMSFKAAIPIIEKKFGINFIYEFSAIKGKQIKKKIIEETNSLPDLLKILSSEIYLKSKMLNTNVIALYYEMKHNETEAPLGTELKSNQSNYREIAKGAYEFSISGYVTDASSGKPISSASVQIKGTNIGTSSNESGYYSINAPKNTGTLVFSYVGYSIKEVAFNNQPKVDIKLNILNTTSEEIIVVGYGTQKKTSLTASVSTIKGADIAKQPVGDLSNSLGGRASGVLFTQPSGQAGNDASRIMIRGIGTNGNSNPLFIVDGVPRNFSQLNPADVESITVLKDAAAVAPYGMAGANGVILVTTKKGKVGKPRLTYDGYVGFQNPTVITQFLNSYDFARMKNEGVLNQTKAGDPIKLPYSEEALQKFKDQSDLDAYSNTKAFDDVFKKNTIITGHNLSLSGGTDVVKYAMGLGYLNQDGLLPGIRYKRYNLSGNMQVQATKSTVVSLSLNGRIEDRNLTTAGYSSQSLFEGISYKTAISGPYVYSNGLYSSSYAALYDNPGYKKVTGNTMLNQFSIEQKLPIKGLSMKFVGSYDWNPFDPYSSNGSGIESFSKSYYSPFSYHDVDLTTNPYTYPLAKTSGQPSLYQEYHQTQAFTYQSFLTYSGNFKKNAVSGLFVLESRSTKSSRFSAGRENYNLLVQELFAGGSAATDQSSNGNSLGTKQRSLVYRVTYGFDGKYLFEAAGRYDGNYYFAPGHRFGYFPAFSAAWRLSEEEFLSDVPWLNELKIKGSWGKSGGLAGAPFQYQPGFTLYGGSAILNGTLTQGLYENAEPNPAITWEVASKTDIGVELNILNNRIHIEADYFNENRNNMLAKPDVTVPQEYGIDISQVNSGSMNNKGFEFSVNAHHDFNKDLRVGLSGNFSHAKNKLIQVFENPGTYDIPSLRRTGRSLGIEFGYKAIGFFSADDFDASGNLKSGIANQTFSGLAPGEIRYADLYGPDGKPDGVIDYRDQIPLGYPQYPAIVYGFSPSVSYKGFELSFLFQGAAKRNILLSNDAVLAFQNQFNSPITALDYWTPTNTNATSPRILPSPSSNTQQPSSLWLRDASYLRLRTGVFSYTLPPIAAKAIGASFVKVYVSGQNLLTWTPLKNFDPEIASSGYGVNGINGNNQRAWYFPTQKAITFGLNIQF